MTKQITVRLPDELHERLKTAAERERRSAHAQVLVCLDQCLDKLEKAHGEDDHNDQVKAGTAFSPPVAKCVNHAVCGGTAVKDGTRCLACMNDVAGRAADLLAEGMHRADAAVALGYRATSGPYVEGLAISLGGYKKPTAQARPQRRAPKRTLRQRVTGWFRRKGGTDG